MPKPEIGLGPACALMLLILVGSMLAPIPIALNSGAKSDIVVVRPAASLRQRRLIKTIITTLPLFIRFVHSPFPQTLIRMLQQGAEEILDHPSLSGLDLHRYRHAW